MNDVVTRLRKAVKEKKPLTLKPADVRKIVDAYEDLVDAGIICRALESGNDVDMDAVSRIGDVTEDWS